MEKLKSYKESKLSGRKIIDTKHAIDRFIDRYDNRYSIERVRKVICDAMSTIIDKYHDESTTYGVWSKSTGICVIIDWRPDTMNKADKRNHAVIITLPPIKSDYKNFHTVNVKDIRLIVEAHLFDAIKKQILREDCSDNKLKEVKLNGLKIFLHEGIIFDSGIAYCFRID